MTDRRLTVVLWALAAIVSVALAAANLCLGDLNQDEGWYLYAARLVSEGQVPYRDFAYTQGPVMPYVYSLAQPMVDKHGVAGGRIVTAFIGLLVWVCAAWLAWRLAPDAGWKRRAALLAFMLCAVNVYQSCFFSVVKTYALSSLWLMAGFVALSFAGRFPRLSVLCAGPAFALAAATRVSAAIVMPVVFVSLVLCARRGSCASAPALETRAGRCRMLPVWFAVSALAACGIVFGPFVLAAPEGFRFGVFEYHAQRAAGSLAGAVAYKAGFVSRVVQAYFAAFCVFAGAVLFRLTKKQEPGPAEDGVVGNELGFVRIGLWSSAAAVTLVHFCAPFPYDDYQVMVFPVFAVVLADWTVRLLRNRDTVISPVLAGVLIVCAASAFSSPINQTWFLAERDRIWWRLKDETPLRKLRRAAGRVREMAGNGEEILTQDTYLAVEAGLRVPHGLELGPFSYFADWPTERTRKIHVLNRETMTDLLAVTRANVAAFSGYGLGVVSPHVKEISGEDRERFWGIINSRYKPEESVNGFGQAGTTLRIFSLMPREKAEGNTGGK